MARIVTLSIARRENATWQGEQDQVVREVPVALRLNGSELVTLLTTPSYMDELAVGYLYGGGFISSRGEVGAVQVDPAGTAVDVTAGGISDPARQVGGPRAITSGCGRGTVFYRCQEALADIPVLTSNAGATPEEVLGLVRKLHQSSLLSRLS